MNDLTFKDVGDIDVARATLRDALEQYLDDHQDDQGTPSMMMQERLATAHHLLMQIEENTREGNEPPFEPDTRIVWEDA